MSLRSSLFPGIRAGILLLVLIAGPEASGSSDPAAECAERAAKLEGKADAAGWFKLALFAQEHLLWDSFDPALRKVLELSPEHAGAHALLDEVKSGDVWMSAEKAEALEADEMGLKGLVFYGSGWVSPK